MKKLLAALLLGMLLFSLCACGEKGDSIFQTREPLIGKWEAQTESMESTVVFEKDSGGLSGTWKTLNYQNNTWQEHHFEISKKTDFTLTFLMDNGKLQTKSYAVFGDTLYLDGAIFTCKGKNVQISDAVKEKTLVVDGKILPIINNLFMGMTRDEVEAVLGEKMEYWMQGGNYAGGYQGKVGDDVYGFDAQLQLVYAQKNLFYNDAERIGEEMLATCTDLFGAPEKSESDFSVERSEYHQKWSTWEVGEYRIILSQVYNKTQDDYAWTSLTFAK